MFNCFVAFLASLVFVIAAPTYTLLGPSELRTSSETPDFQTIQKSVFSVSADSCVGGSPQQATAFVWHRQDTLVTALHAIAGCSGISVKDTNSGRTWPATVTRALIKRDLALLSIAGAPPLAPMNESNELLQNDQPLWTWGFQLGAPTPSERRFHKLEGAETLGAFVSSDVAHDIQTSGMPDLSTEIIYVSGLVPGLSGAPIFDSSGAVVGIGDGGLNGGSVGVNWAIPEKYLGDLLESSDNVNVVATMNLNEFAFDQSVSSGSATSVNCNGRTFTKLPIGLTVGLAIRGTDNPIGLTQLATAFQMVNSGSMVFDSYTDFSSGATFVLPQGVEPSSSSSGCTAQIPGSPITFAIEVSSYNPSNPSDAMSVTNLFTSHILTQVPPGIWQINPAWTTPQMYQPRFDTFAAQRVNWVKLPAPPQQPQPIEGVFDTTAIKRGTFLGVAASAPVSYTQNPALPICLQSPNNQGCQPILERLHNWGSAVIAVHLATFPIG